MKQFLLALYLYYKQKSIFCFSSRLLMAGEFLPGVRRYRKANVKFIVGRRVVWGVVDDVVKPPT